VATTRPYRASLEPRMRISSRSSPNFRDHYVAVAIGSAQRLFLRRPTGTGRLDHRPQGVRHVFGPLQVGQIPAPATSTASRRKPSEWARREQDHRCATKIGRLSFPTCRHLRCRKRPCLNAPSMVAFRSFQPRCHWFSYPFQHPFSSWTPEYLDSHPCGELTEEAYLT
jgi:hypothetical protein